MAEGRNNLFFKFFRFIQKQNKMLLSELPDMISSGFSLPNIHELCDRKHSSRRIDVIFHFHANTGRAVGLALFIAQKKRA
ncbi:CLUMA_CG018501, isoform A [Clunio marinus]|uniref:CLUMA_CG018501, isoform A n=1 Tax=Clunio marinus TaxID=568069 RepID=A0A1J1J2X8_9DIPT|nr:CLUMA_CG018501, isoform A [Clunio marinus]